jgi:DNA polymerase-1
MAKSLYIIDAHAHIYAAEYAPMRGQITSPSGEPTKATYIFTMAILGLIQRQKPDMLVVALDRQGADVSQQNLRRLQGPPPADAR